MDCVENNLPANGDSEMEEGEIVDEIDELSDISSEEEFLLRQRLQVLENYNNVLERKKAKNSLIGSENILLKDLSDISASELEENFALINSKDKLKACKDIRGQRNKKLHQRTKRKNIDLYRGFGRHKGHKKKNSSNKKRLHVKIISETSDESEDEYRNKRRKLADAVVVPRDKNDKSSLHARLQNMLCESKNNEFILNRFNENKEFESSNIEERQEILESTVALPQIPGVEKEHNDNNSEGNREQLPEQPYDINSKVLSRVVEVSSDDGLATIIVNDSSQDALITCQPNVEREMKKESDKDSDEDLELLRQHALKTKASKAKPEQIETAVIPQNKPSLLSEDEDSDTTELRLICLKSTLLKKAIERKQKQRLKKRLSQSSNLQDDFLREVEELENQNESENNNTDIESVDMDIGSDAEEKVKENENDKHVVSQPTEKLKVEENITKEDELEEDEDLLRAKLLTSLSKNLPNLVDPNILSNIEESGVEKMNPPPAKTTLNIPEEKRIVINVGESDSEGEHEATKNLTKMHIKLSEQVDFQQKLDMFLKSTRMEVEKAKPPNEKPKTIVPPTSTDKPKPPARFVAKAVNNLPKTEQIEYKNLVKRMAELEKIKKARQTPLSLVNKSETKETLKPKNISIDTAKLIAVNNLEEQIALSRKKIAEESARIISLKEEATKLSQKYKIVATELRNISTAITLNKKQQRTVQIKLSKIREQHQNLLNSSIAKHSNINNLSFNKPNMKIVTASKLQKENNPSKEDCSKTYAANLFKSVKVNVANNDTSTPNNGLSVQVDVGSHKKTVKLPANKFSVAKNDTVTPNNGLSVQADVGSNKDAVNLPANIQKGLHETDVNRIEKNSLKESYASLPVVEKGGGKRNSSTDGNRQIIKNNGLFMDYQSPLQALDEATYYRRKTRKMCMLEMKCGWKCVPTSPPRRAVWEGDPNAILCPFEVGGNCKDADCKYFHPKIPANQ